MELALDGCTRKDLNFVYYEPWQKFAPVKMDLDFGVFSFHPKTFNPLRILPNIFHPNTFHPFSTEL